MSHELLGTKYCPNCAIINEKVVDLDIREAEIIKRELELDKEMDFIYKSKLKTN